MKAKMMEEFEKEVGYIFQDKTLLATALTHSSYSNEKHMKKSQCNERLEFLGDAVLELVSSEFIFRNHPDMPEGEMTVNRLWHFVPKRFIWAITSALAREKS